MAIPTILEAIDRGYISTYLAANDNAKGALFGAKKAPVSPVTIALVTDALFWGNDGGAQTATSIRETANYLVWLCNKWGQQADVILGNGGGGVVVPGVSSLPLPKYFIVSSTSFMVTGASSTTISTFIGYNLIFTRGGVPQSTVITEPTYFTWDNETGDFSCIPELYEGELIGLIPV